MPPFLCRKAKAVVQRALLALTVGACALAWAPPASAQTGLPTLGDGSELGSSAERRLGDRIIRELYRDPDYIDDPVLEDYVQGLWQSLLAAARARGELSAELDERFAWEVLLGRDRSVNAFALPGGYLGLHLGLVGVTSTRDELASVLAHELSHVLQRHVSRLLTAQKKQTPLLLGALVLGALAASKNPDAAQALVVGGRALLLQNQLNFSRDMEREADRIGYGLMAPAGFAPQGFVGMFDKLQQANRLNDNGSWPYLRSHPLTTERSADMHARIPPGTAIGATAAAPATLEHALVAARARVLANPGVDSLRQWIAEPHSSGWASQPLPHRAAALYVAALGSSQLRDAAGARAAAQKLDDLVRNAPDARQASDPATRRLLGLLNAEIELAAGAADAALQALQALPAGSDTGRPELLLRTRALLQARRAGEGAQALQTWVANHPKDATAWQLLAAVAQAQGQTLRAVRAEAEAHAARYDYAAAADRFKAGQDLARRSGAAVDHIDASIIDTRLRAMESLLREQAAER
ncbi:M48 family metalloprotease [Verminephrobacter eiseniae]|uniref:Peptidase M48, Ste24p n=2 Tax=Verminephrobacter eiseniae TaxID=364317 RepID=A1WEX3_VEREI|nr:M48 family metalloprotease [Verminephrobacter eiseniae]ABM56180.1 peptidase M48, Ste24p [Verminephrobacter eiseniae EF01-2]MCW5286551.1 peptidase M48 [Verminephrobacter eiseniae]MCW5304850.1 peptidase M48 [Verminephrobacter eiseniae]MCW8190020.1 peptidase M48 [Verminephrobacter eiseniae]